MSPDQWIQLIMGAATLVNSLILWPIVRSLKRNDKQHSRRLSRLERKR